MKKWIIIFLFAASFSAGCIPLSPAEYGSRDLFQPLLRADLAAFQHKLTIDHHLGRADAWTEVGQAFLALATCNPIDGRSSALLAEPDAALLHQLAVVEETRRLRLISQARHFQRRVWHQDTVHTQFTSRSFFNRTPGPLDQDLIRWPDPKDAWQDEQPAPVEVAYDCEALGDDVDEDLPFYLEQEWKQTDKILQMSAELTPSEPLRQQARINIILHRADLALLSLELGNDDFFDDLAISMADQALMELQSITEQAANEQSLAFAQSLRLSALASALDDADLLVEALATLLEHPDQGVANTARYLLMKSAWTKGWWEIVIENSSPLAPRSSPLYSAQAYFTATAHLYLGHPDRFLASARQALQNRPRDDQDPFLGALYRETLQFLAGFDVDERTEELLEEFGPRSRLMERQKELASVALDMGRPEVTRALVEPLLEQSNDARELPGLHALLALASFFEDNRPGFIHHLDAIATRPNWANELIPRSRRAAFFAPQDRELAKVLRAILPLMAEWGDDDQAQALRQPWLELVVEKTQNFLRWAPESIVSDDLSDLYTLASELLKQSARGYAAQIGAEGLPTSALILGTVGLPGLPPLSKAPSPRLRWRPLPSLLLIPADGIPPTEFISHIPSMNREEHP